MKTILLAEDDPFIVDIYASQFRAEGYKVDIAKDGKIAIDRVKASIPDLLMLDISLPQLNGWDVLRMIREDQKTKHLKVIIVSNLNQKDAPPDYPKLGVLQYFLKVETTPEEIVNAVKEILK